jgi:hypothetical protein
VDPTADGRGVALRTLWDLVKLNLGVDKEPVEEEEGKGALGVTLLDAVDATGVLFRTIWIVRSPVRVPVDAGVCNFQLKVIVCPRAKYES